MINLINCMIHILMKTKNCSIIQGSMQVNLNTNKNINIKIKNRPIIQRSMQNRVNPKIPKIPKNIKVSLMTSKSLYNLMISKSFYNLMIHISMNNKDHLIIVGILMENRNKLIIHK
jgi:hypothetical protein